MCKEYLELIFKIMYYIELKPNLIHGTLQIS